MHLTPSWCMLMLDVTRVPLQAFMMSDGISDGCFCHSCLLGPPAAAALTFTNRSSCKPMRTFQSSSPHLVLQIQYPPEVKNVLLHNKEFGIETIYTQKLLVNFKNSK